MFPKVEARIRELATVETALAWALTRHDQFAAKWEDVLGAVVIELVERTQHLTELYTRAKRVQRIDLVVEDRGGPRRYMRYACDDLQGLAGDGI